MPGKRDDTMKNDHAQGMYYTIRVREKLESTWDEWFEGMTLTADPDGTLLSGYLPDQSALHGIIGRVQRLGLHLIAVTEEERGTTNEGL